MSNGFEPVPGAAAPMEAPTPSTLPVSPGLVPQITEIAGAQPEASTVEFDGKIPVIPIPTISDKLDSPSDVKEAIDPQVAEAAKRAEEDALTEVREKLHDTQAPAEEKIPEQKRPLARKIWNKAKEFVKNNNWKDNDNSWRAGALLSAPGSIALLATTGPFAPFIKAGLVKAGELYIARLQKVNYAFDKLDIQNNVALTDEQKVKRIEELHPRGAQKLQSFLSGVSASALYTGIFGGIDFAAARGIDAGLSVVNLGKITSGVKTLGEASYRSLRGVNVSSTPSFEETQKAAGAIGDYAKKNLDNQIEILKDKGLDTTTGVAAELASIPESFPTISDVADTVQERASSLDVDQITVPALGQVESLTNQITDQTSRIGNVGGAIIESAQDASSNVGEAVSFASSQVGDAVETAASNTGNAAENAYFNATPHDLAEAGASLAANTADVVTNATSEFSPPDVPILLDATSDAAESVQHFGESTVGIANTALSNATHEIGNNIHVVQEPLSTAGDAVVDGYNAVENVASKAIDSVQEIANTDTQPAREHITNAVSSSESISVPESVNQAAETVNTVGETVEETDNEQSSTIAVGAASGVASGIATSIAMNHKKAPEIPKKQGGFFKRLFKGDL